MHKSKAATRRRILKAVGIFIIAFVSLCLVSQAVISVEDYWDQMDLNSRLAVNYGHGEGPVEPHVVITQTVSDLNEVKDTVLEYALRRD